MCSFGGRSCQKLARASSRLPMKKFLAQFLKDDLNQASSPRKDCHASILPHLFCQSLEFSVPKARKSGVDAAIFSVLTWHIFAVSQVAPLRMFLGFWVMGRPDWKGSQAEDGSLMIAKADASVS